MENLNRTMEEALNKGVFPGACMLVSLGWEVVFRSAWGFKSIIPQKKVMELNSIFDLASLTKPLLTTLCIMDLVENDTLHLNATLGDVFSKSAIVRAVPKDKALVTLRQLLTHTGGFMAYYPFFKEYSITCSKEIIWQRIFQIPLIYEPGKDTVYSDLGFMILECVINSVTGVSLKEYALNRVLSRLELEGSFVSGLTPELKLLPKIVPTEYCEWRQRLIRGVVHDENAYLMGGYSGHAGLFSTVDDVYKIVLHIFKRVMSSSKLWAFWEPQKDLGTGERALGWDMPSKTNSSTGKYFSQETVGHLGFTGCSVWLDLKRELLVVLLTNRIHPSRQNERLKEFRPLIHDAVMKDLGFC